MRTIADAPLLLIAQSADPQRRLRLEQLGCQIFDVGHADSRASVELVLNELGRRNMTNVLLEGGSHLLGSFLDAGQIDECLAFVAPKLVGGADAVSPIGGTGIASIDAAVCLSEFEILPLGDDACLRGRIVRSDRP